MIENLVEMEAGIPFLENKKWGTKGYSSNYFNGKEIEMSIKHIVSMEWRGKEKNQKSKSEGSNRQGDDAFQKDKTPKRMSFKIRRPKCKHNRA